MPAMKGFLEPGERVAEVLFGLIMVLTFTGTLSAAEADRAEVRTMLIGALGCNLAWGIIDAILYLMGRLSDQGRGVRAVRMLHEAASPQEGQRIVADALPPLVAATLGPEELEPMRRKLAKLPPPPRGLHLGINDWLAALGVFLWVFATTFPVAVPFLFMHDAVRALRVSNAIAIGLLFVAGYAFGRYSEFHPWLTGVAMVGLGVVLVAITIALGG
jgi:VIT1/CCC1 family predicted Fe2+/Mn2+ transporter